MAQIAEAQGMQAKAEAKLEVCQKERKEAAAIAKLRILEQATTRSE